jgi:hypothetical protein
MHEMKYEEKIKGMNSAKKIPTKSAQDNLYEHHILSLQLSSHMPL